MQHYLITNIDMVTLTGGTVDIYGSTEYHLHASAILLTRNDHAPRPLAHCTIRILGPDPAWPITSLASTSIDHKISPLPSDVPGAIQIHYALHVDDRWDLKLVTASQDGAPPDVIAYPEGTPIGDVWRDLCVKVAEHWHAPNMPTLQWLPADHVRTLSKRERL